LLKKVVGVGCERKRRGRWLLMVKKGVGRLVEEAFLMYAMNVFENDQKAGTWLSIPIEKARCHSHS
jgi:hypothetical protein